MLLFREQDNPDGLLLTRLPEEAKTKTVTRKKNCLSVSLFHRKGEFRTGYSSFSAMAVA